MKHSKLDLVFGIYMISSAIVAAIGLSQDSVTIITASTLLSPMMNFMLCTSHGFVHREHGPIVRGGSGTLLSVGICLGIGALTGVALYVQGLPPSYEMVLRTKWSVVVANLALSFLAGVANATSAYHMDLNASGAAALSTGLVPPLVNFGILTVYAVLTRADAECMRRVQISLVMSVMGIVVIHGAMTMTLLVLGLHTQPPNPRVLNWVSSTLSIVSNTVST